MSLSLASLSENEVHIRCQGCHQYIAGPLSAKTLDGCPSIGLTEFIDVGRIDFTIDPFIDLSAKPESDLLLHAQWYDGWRSQ